MTDSFVHLHVHTEYSMLDGAAKVAPLFDKIVELGQPAVALTDHGNMFGADAFYQQSRRTDVKPILGIEAYVAPESRFHKKPVFWGQQNQRGSDEFGEGGDVSGSGAYTHTTMWAENVVGLRNLFKMSTLASSQGYYRRPRMDRDLFEQMHEGVIASTGCPSGEVQTRLRLGQRQEAIQAASDYKDIFGAGNFFLELMDHGLPIERSVREGLLEVGRLLDLPPLPTNDSHYVSVAQAGAHAALLCVQSGKTLHDPSRFKLDGDGYYLKSAAEMRDYWDKELPGAADNTLLIAERVQSYEEVFTHKDRMPFFDPPKPALMQAAIDLLDARQISDPEVVYQSRPLMLRVEPEPNREHEVVDGLRQALVGNQGDTQVCLLLCMEDDERAFVAEQYAVGMSSELLRALAQLDGVSIA